MVFNLRQNWIAFRQQVVEQDTFDLVARITLILLIVQTINALWYDHFPMTLVTFCAIIHQPLLRSPGFWIGVGAYRLFTTSFNWMTADNHTWLYAYWCLALGCSLLLEDRNRAIALNGRVMIGLVFSFATIWKLTSPEFLDGSALHFVLHQDSRAFELSRVLGDFTLDVGTNNRSVVPEMSELYPIIQLVDAPSLPWLAKVLTWWTIAIEAAISVLFLLPTSSRLSRWRHLLLWVFVVTTYLPIEVTHFGLILLVMGVAQCPAESPRPRFAYLVLMPVIYAFYDGHLKHYLFNEILS